MAVYNQSAQDLKKLALQKSGEVTDGTSSYDATAMGYINKAHLKLLEAGNEIFPELSDPWPWAIEPSRLILVLNPPFTTGTVSVTAQNTTITFTTIPVDALGNQISVLNWWIKLTDRPEWFKISAHTSGQLTATIDCPYTDATASGQTFNCVQLDYTLSPTNGILRLAQALRVYRAQGFLGDEENYIYLDDEQAMLREYAMSRIQQGTPTRFCVMNKSTAGVYTIRFNLYVASQTRVEIPYVKIPDVLRDLPTNPFTATITIASPAVVTATAHGLASGDSFVFTTTGALPTGASLGTTYYVINPTQDTFQLSASVGGAAINTSGTQSGILTVNPSQPATYPLVPSGQRDALAYVTAYWLCLDKNDDRAQQYLALAQSAFEVLKKASHKEKLTTGKNRGRLIPRGDTYSRGKKYVPQEVS